MTDNLPAKTDDKRLAIPDAAPAGIAQFVETQRALYVHFADVGTALARASMLPKGMNAQQACVVMMHGNHMYGWPAMKSLHLLTCINNRVGMYAETMVALARERGIAFSYDVDREAVAVSVTGRNRETDEAYTARWSLQDAELAGYTRNQLYKSIPTTMLRHRAEAEVCRALDSAHLANTYLPEEIAAMTPDVPAVDGETRTEQVKNLLGVGGGAAQEKEGSEGDVAQQPPAAPDITEEAASLFEIGDDELPE